MDWSVILPILQLIWTATNPALKAAALAELKTLEVVEKDKPILLYFIKEAEVLVAAA